MRKNVFDVCNSLLLLRLCNEVMGNRVMGNRVCNGVMGKRV